MKWYILGLRQSIRCRRARDRSCKEEVLGEAQAHIAEREGSKMKDTDFQVVRRIEARSFMEGPEHCREYFTTDKLTFGTSTLPPGQAGATDPGHPESHEVFFAAKGHVLVRLGDPGPHFELKEGDAILIPEGVSHTIINVGEETALIVWASAPVHRDPSDKL